MTSWNIEDTFSNSRAGISIGALLSHSLYNIKLRFFSKLPIWSISIDFYAIPVYSSQPLLFKMSLKTWFYLICFIHKSTLRFYSSGFESKYVFRLDSSRHESKFPFSIKIKWKIIEIRYFLHFDSSTVEGNRNVKMHFQLDSTVP